MARGTTLDKLLNDLRAACRISLNAAHNAQHRDAQVQSLQRKQEWYWDDFAWPHLRVDRFIELQAGQRYYDMPTDLDITRINHIQVRMNSLWQGLKPGIDSSHYAAYDSDMGVRGSPVQRWNITEDEQIELWPIPDTNFDAATLEGKLKITGIRKLSPLIADGDRADLDDQLLVMSCAADYLAANGAKDSQLKLDQANRIYAKYRAQLMPRRIITIGVNTGDRHVERIPIAIHNKTS
jgi:hypothetical protein